MLSKCKKRIEKKEIENVKLKMMNVEELDYPDNHFSHVIVMYVVSVTPNPQKKCWKNLVGSARQVVKL